MTELPPTRRAPLARNSWVDAAPFMLHTRWLLAVSGLPWRALAVAAGVPSGVVRALAGSGPRTGRMRSRDAARLLKLQPDTLAERARTNVPIHTTRRMMRILSNRGWPDAAIAEFVGCDEFSVTAIRMGHRDTCFQEWEWRVEAAAEAHGLIEFNYDMPTPAPDASACEYLVDNDPTDLPPGGAPGLALGDAALADDQVA